LNRLNEKYEEWVKNYNEGKLLIIDVDNLDFVNNPEDLGYIYDKVDAELHGLF
jgi:deoxyadenosine/deoxycytidine kinase